MILLIDLVLICYVFYLWYIIERKWHTIYISHNPTNIYWNHVYIPEGADASIGIQAAIDFLGEKKRGGITRFDAGIYDVHNIIELKGRVCLQGEKR